MRILVCVLLGAAGLSIVPVDRARAEERHYAIERPRTWIRSDMPDILSGPGASEATDGVENLAVDRQIRLTAKGAEEYTRFIDRVVSETGVDESATITIDFDPHSDELALHSFKVMRGGQAIEQLALDRVSVLRREDQLEEGLIDGHLTLSLLLEDVRPGDVIDYSYTRRIDDPLIGAHYQAFFTTQWSAPVRWSRLRLLHPPERSVQIQVQGNETQPIVREDADWKDTVWEWRDLPGIPFEGERPSWHVQYPRLNLSDWRSWAEVVAWAEPMYRPQPLSDEMVALTTQWRTAARSDAERIILALRFVQDQIRYTGIEIGPGAYRPTDSRRVLARRFGDCKDKTLLLVTLLRAMQIDARPALVNTWRGRHIEDTLPGHAAFDHIIARVHHEGGVYWLDATSSLQGGALQTVEQSRFGAALVLAEGVAKLERIPEATSRGPTTVVVETFDLAAGVSAKGALEVKTVYLGADADGMRRELQESTTEEIARSYLKYYREWYPPIKQVSALRATDDREANRIEVIESYEIEPAFENQGDGSMQFEFNPDIVAARAAAPKLVHRRTPLRVAHPRHVRYEASVLLPSAWNVETEDVTIEDSAFLYTSRLSYKDRRFKGEYEFQTRSDFVPADQAQEYARKLEQVRDDASYWFSHDGAAQAKGSVNLVALIAAALGLSLGVLLARRIRAQSLRARADASENNAPRGLGGWMVLPLLHTCIMPLAMAAVLYSYWWMVGSTAWNEIGEGASDLAIQFLKLGYFVSALCAFTLLVMSIDAVYLLFARRRAFPFAYVALTWSLLGWAALNMLIDYALPGAYEDAVQAGAEMVGNLLSGALWTAYMLRSTRVAATFVRENTAAPVRPRRDPTPPPSDAAPAAT